MARALLIVALLWLSCAAIAQNVAEPDLTIFVNIAKGRITRLDAVRQPAKKVLTALLQAARRRGSVDDKVHGEITVSLRDVGLETGLQQVAQLADATCRTVDGKFEITAAEDRMPGVEAVRE